MAQPFSSTAGLTETTLIEATTSTRGALPEDYARAAVMEAGADATCGMDGVPMARMELIATTTECARRIRPADVRGC